MRTEKLEKYREERNRQLEKLAYIQERVKELDRKIAEGESLEIRALMKTENMTLNDLTTLVRQMRARGQIDDIEKETKEYAVSAEKGDDALDRTDIDEEDDVLNEEV